MVQGLKLENGTRSQDAESLLRCYCFWGDLHKCLFTLDRELMTDYQSPT